MQIHHPRETPDIQLSYSVHLPGKILPFASHRVEMRFDLLLPLSGGNRRSAFLRLRANRSDRRAVVPVRPLARRKATLPVRSNREFPCASPSTQSAFANQQAAGRQKRKEPKCRRYHAGSTVFIASALLPSTGIFPVKRVYSAVYKHILNYMHKWGFRQVFCT